MKVEEEFWGFYAPFHMGRGGLWSRRVQRGAISLELRSPVPLLYLP